MEKTTVKGVWWLESEPRKQLQGEITYGPTSGAEVDLFGQLYDSFDDRKLSERFTLHGLTFNATRISLFGSLITSGEIHLPGGTSCKIRSCSGVVGGHFHSLDDVLFKEVYVQLKGLTDWTCITGMDLKAGGEPKSFVAAYKVPTAIVLGKYGMFSIRMEFTGHLQPGFHGLQFREECVLVITAEQMQPLTEFQERILTFQRFLSLAIQRPAPPTQIIGHIDKPSEVIQNTPIFDDFLIIRELVVPNWSRETLSPQNLLFSLPELGCSPASVFGRFVERQASLLASMDLYFATLYNEGQTPRVEFLTLAQGLEAYHRAAMPPGRYVSDECYGAGLRKKLVDAIPADDLQVDADFRSSLSNKLNYLHEFSLERRLREIAKKHAGIVGPLIGKPEEFSRAASHLRNELTHPGDGSCKAERDHRKLRHLSEQMALLLEVCFLGEIGFSSEQMNGIVSTRSRRADRIRRGWV